MHGKRLFLFVFLFAATAFAGQPPFGDLHWRLLGPFRGGRVLAVTGVPSEPDHFYFGSVNGGVWETHDAGRTWQPIFDHVFPPSADLYIPSPWAMSERMSASPLPT